MRNLLLAVGVAGLVGLFTACSDDRPPPRDDGPVGARAGNTGLGTAGSSSPGNGGEGGQGDAGPLVQIISPEAVTDPADGVLSELTVEVLCTVQQGPGGADVDQTSIRLSLHDEAGAELQEKSATATDNPDEYTADFVLETVPSGAVSFRCTASGKDKLQTTDEIATFVDHGPTITILSPEPDTAHPLKGGLSVDFTVEPTELAVDDVGAAVDQVTFTLDNRDIDIEEVSAGQYQATIFLDDTAEFPEIPSGAIAITATNSRSPEPVTASKEYNILVDGVGPVIVIESPKPTQVVGGVVTLVFRVTDVGSGVDPLSVNVTLAQDDEPRFYNPNQGWTRNADRYSLTFDTKAVEDIAQVQMTINVVGSDLVGNLSASGQSLQLYLDNHPPQVDLDPLNVRMFLAGKCTGAFDPVGDAAANDLQGAMGEVAVTRIELFRLFVYERTNSIPGQIFFQHAQIDQTQVRLYAQPEPDSATIKLLINKNPGQDDICDDIGGIDDIATAPTFTAMLPLPKTPNSALWYQDDPGNVPLVGTVCALEAGTAPQRLCAAHNSDMWYAAYHGLATNEPLVYAVTPGGGDSCAGIDWEFIGANRPEGWVCLAGRAVDKAGNIGISPPLRVCVDDLGTPEQPPCRISSTVPPTCTDGCTPPARGGNLIIDVK